MIRVLIYILLFTFFALETAAQETVYRFLPAGIHFMPLKASFEESRVGTLYYPENGNLKVDIGNNIDLFAIFFGRQRISFGIEFMAYGLSTNFGGNRLQIESIDGFFGGNLAYSYQYSANRLKARFRFVHNSAHLVDGSYIPDLNEWKNNRAPIPFTRDFLELTVAHEISVPFGILQYYGSGSYSVLVRPDQLGRAAVNAGLEISSNSLLGTIFDRESNVFLAYHFNLRNYGSFNGSSHLIGGLKMGEWLNKGIVFYASFYSGNHMFNEYYDEKISKIGLGFFIDFI